MEDKDKIITELKAECYDLNRQLMQTNSILQQLAQHTEAQTVDELLEKVQKAFAKKVD